MDKTQMFQIIHYIQALIYAMPEGMHQETLVITLKNSTGTISAELTVPDPVDETAMKTTGHYPTIVMVSAGTGKTIIRSSYLMITPDATSSGLPQRSFRQHPELLYKGVKYYIRRKARRQMRGRS
ncbi:MAG: hypothetical protein MJ014_02260 [Methanocorpusculum sp.]|nr:hypothetical protein [Methanocorpusculum sp.]